VQIGEKHDVEFRLYFFCRGRRSAAGLPGSKRLHTLRRSLGTSMLASGIPVTTMAQVLGHAEVDSTKKYIAVDKAHLKMCALPFDGIKLKGGVRK